MNNITNTRKCPLIRIKDLRKHGLIIIGLLFLTNIYAQEPTERFELDAPTKTTGIINNLGIQLFNTAGYDDIEASFWASVSNNPRHNVNLRLSHHRFEGEYFGIGLGYGYEFYANNHLFLPYSTYNHNVETWNNGALVNGLYYSYGGRFDFAVGTTTNFTRGTYSNNSLWLDAYYNIKALGGIQLGVEYCVMADTKDVYWGIILQKTLWRRNK
ncbi:hypothetical protein [Saccharicrinis aurantiacus]|uniref:hypothetical protein n=1 Tax=Saccharicrinis aurantiacus TaxID=1849719 RepID=UPI00248F8F3D|nr:hypothetical protein [Saccharicrinis aurantiacus]